MPLEECVVPAYRLHKSSGQARVIINGEHIYLGKFNSPESQQNYDRLIAEWMSKGRPKDSVKVVAKASTGPTVNELILAFWQYAVEHYVKNGEPTSEIRSFRSALRPVRQLYGTEPVTRFGPLALTACRQKLIEAGICRKRINQHVGRIRLVFKWGVACEMVPEGTWSALRAVTGLRRGAASERPRVKLVPEERIKAIAPFVTPQVQAMIDLQLWSACRPGEAFVMRGIDINMQGPIWEFRPSSHKLEHHDIERVIFLGPHAQAIIKPWLVKPIFMPTSFRPGRPAPGLRPRGRRTGRRQSPNWSESPSENQSRSGLPANATPTTPTTTRSAVPANWLSTCRNNSEIYRPPRRSPAGRLGWMPPSESDYLGWQQSGEERTAGTPIG